MNCGREGIVACEHTSYPSNISTWPLQVCGWFISATNSVTIVIRGLWSWFQCPNVFKKKGARAGRGGATLPWLAGWLGGCLAGRRLQWNRSFRKLVWLVLLGPAGGALNPRAVRLRFRFLRCKAHWQRQPGGARSGLVDDDDEEEEGGRRRHQQQQQEGELSKLLLGWITRLPSSFCLPCLWLYASERFCTDFTPSDRFAQPSLFPSWKLKLHLVAGPAPSQRNHRPRLLLHSPRSQLHPPHVKASRLLNQVHRLTLVTGILNFSPPKA